VLRRLVRRAYVELLAALPDRLAIQIEARRTLGRFLDLDHGTTFSEKVNRRKLDKELAPAMAALADKLRVKAFVEERLGSAFVTPTLWHGKALPPEPPSGLPDRFVIKFNTGSGANLFVDKHAMDWAALRRKTARFGSTTTASRHKEHWYKLIDPQILIEPMLASPGDLPDYKCYVFHGRVEFMQADVGRHAIHRRGYYDRDWVQLPFTKSSIPLPEFAISAPLHLPGIIDAAETLAAGWDFVRVDFYDRSEGPLFGEMTFSPFAGFARYHPDEYDRITGELWHMP
jgi:hypothetical protein